MPNPSSEGESAYVLSGPETPGIAPGEPSPDVGTSAFPSLPSVSTVEESTTYRSDWDTWGVDSTKRAREVEHSLFLKVLCCLKRDRPGPRWTPWDKDETVRLERTYGDEQLWSLGTVCTVAWVELRLQIRGIIMHTPGRSNNSSTSVVLQSFLVGADRDHLQPTVYISASSNSYAKTLLRVIKRSGVLERDNLGFDVKIKDQYKESSEKPRPKREPDMVNRGSMNV
ncbi:hypothetical protein PV08_11622 [Exophiala spinifera]|uniref:Uncharacterized protein n=1 Tax=Exophiala spinifera TaxID=91928 RepID=A0A0D2AVA9_9EURO|nr:uncharacterized protein PV08_11622 [Exophiala spinifera]KIW10658.1 hypothetical protein PV08_11622 [Exophiala spinifera]